jgi:hypothetical protein
MSAYRPGKQLFGRDEDGARPPASLARVETNIKGGGTTCWPLCDLDQARIRLDSAIHEFVRRAVQLDPSDNAPPPELRRPVRHGRIKRPTRAGETLRREFTSASIPTPMPAM